MCCGRGWVRKISNRLGEFAEDIERRIVKRPWEYGLGIDLIDGKIVWVRDIVGVVPSKRDGLFKGIIRKEGYLTLLGKEADESFVEAYLILGESKIRDLIHTLT